jgi:hypothetical protein
MYDHVLVGTDGSISAVRAIGTAARLAQAHHARLTIAHAFADRPAVPGTEATAATEATETGLRHTPRAVAESLVSASADHAQTVASGDLEIDTRAEPGTAVGVLRALIDELSPDAVVVSNADVRRALGRRGVGNPRTRRTGHRVVIVDSSRAAR